MHKDSKLVRECDGKEFAVTFLSHWSEIKSVNGDGECDRVKYYGSEGKYDLYVSANNGFGYTYKV